MNYGKILPMKTLKNLQRLLPLLLLVVALNACRTQAPTQNAQSQASFDPIANGYGNHQNSGLLGFTDARSASIVITPTARERFNSLIPKYGSKMLPPATVSDYGLTPYTNHVFTFYNKGRLMPAIPPRSDLWEMNINALEDFGLMSQMAANPSR